ncbi:MAG: hypothetical protein KJ852_01410 [Gammaproteobacteria bacterium]|nr:hypothetical protein [Gammaproteobacteria bacterium]MBU0788210.1 hypothetical protein [Gammaproteobacteria bacterium]MBU0815293.1 hypothetical protein [Gammaproteobacteria bacterium]MBU1785599.1 hypothetical protein [Gammaproteobacteria bacterium]
MKNFWPSSGFDQLERNARDWLIPADNFLRIFLARPELALVPESCPAEITLHEALQAAPSRPVAPHELEALQDDDARDNYRMFLNFRDALLAAGTLEAYYLALFRSGKIDIPPLFVDLIAKAILRNLLDDSTDAFEVRAAEMLFRAQRISIQDGQVLSGDREVLDLLNETGGMGAVGRLLIESKAPVRTVNMEVLVADNAARYWQADERHNFLLDLTHEVTNDLSHGLVFTMTRARSGLKALARVLEKWVAHFLGVQVSIQPEQKVDDPAWRWHVGLDTESTALLNDLYEDRPVSPERLQRVVSLFRLTFNNTEEMRADVAGKPVYLGLTMNAEGIVRLKPQNLLLNLPLAASM